MSGPLFEICLLLGLAVVAWAVIVVAMVAGQAAVHAIANWVLRLDERPAHRPRHRFWPFSEAPGRAQPRA